LTSISVLADYFAAYKALTSMKPDAIIDEVSDRAFGGGRSRIPCGSEMGDHKKSTRKRNLSSAMLMRETLVPT
jgi:NADH:ubiquinone oxidoreductase subunit F (NADH-binding)